MYRNLTRILGRKTDKTAQTPSSASQTEPPATAEPATPALERETFIFPSENAWEASICIESEIPEMYRGMEGIDRAALVAVTFTDAQNHYVIPFDDLPISAAVGAYTYLKSEIGNPGKTEFRVRIPPRTTKLALELRRWRQEVPTILHGEPKIEFSSEIAAPLSTLQREIHEATQTSTSTPLILLYTSAPGLDHPSLTLRPGRLAREYAKLGYRVIYFPFGNSNISDIRQGERIWQFSRTHLATILSSASQVRQECVFICSSFPDIHALAAIDFANAHGWNTLYEIRDDMEEFNRVGYSTWYRPRLEMYAARRARFITTVSPRLADKIELLGAVPDKVRVIPNGIEPEFAERTKPLRTIEMFEARHKSKVIGYIGHLTPAWFDWPLIIRAAQQNPDLTFEIIGHGAPNNLTLPSNIHLLGAKSHEEFIEISKKWQIGLIPFKPSKLTYSVDPNKLYEYLSVGLKVLSAEMGSVDSSPITTTYKRRQNFESMLKLSLIKRVKNEDIYSIEDYLSSSSWNKRALQTLDFIGLEQ